MAQCAVMITDHIDRKSQCSREENHAGEHCANVITEGEVQRVFARNHVPGQTVVPYSVVVTVEPDDVELECDSCGVTYIKHEHMGNYCTQCSFWLSRAKDFKKLCSEKITGAEKASLVTPDYKMFSVCPSDTRGFSGAYFAVGLLDSNEVVRIKGLWHCGTVPLHLRDKFEPNVRFVILEA